MATDAVTTADLLARAAEARVSGAGVEAAALYTRAADLAEEAGDLPDQVEAVLGLARCQAYNVAPGALPVRLHAAYERSTQPSDRARLGAALARCWAYAGEPRRAVAFADQALALADGLADPPLLCDALDAALATYWGPDDLERRRGWSLRLADAAAHLRDPDARLQAHLWGLTVAWELLDLTRMHHEMRALELLAEEVLRARFFAASRRLALDLLRGRTDTAPELCRQAEQATEGEYVPDGRAVLHAMTAYTAWQTGDASTCAAEAATYEQYAVDEGVPVVLAEAAVVWMGARRPDRVAAVIAPFTAEVLAGLPRHGDWLLTMQCLLEGALAVGERTMVSDIAAMLAPYAGRSVVNAGAVMFHGVTDDTLSRAHALLGDLDEAQRLRKAALETYERIGATWWRDRLQASSVEPSDAPSGAHRAQLRHEQDNSWTVGSGGRSAHLPDLRGLGYLHTLVERPGVPVPAATLVGARVGGGMPVDGDLGELLDERARREYRARLADIEQELAEAEEWHDDGRRELALDERDALLAELGAATGLGGRARTPGSTQERARIAVRKALVSAIARVAEVDPWLGRHLHDRVRTGTDCVYDPDPDRPVAWVTD